MEWIRHVKSWYQADFDDRKILYITYERLCDDLDAVLKDICEFSGINTTNELVENAIKSSRIERIRSIEEKFGTPDKYVDQNFRFASSDVERNKIIKIADDSVLDANIKEYQKIIQNKIKK
jgi:hypothetical protein